MTLLDETLIAMAGRGRSPADVMWVGSPTYGWWSWSEYADTAAAMEGTRGNSGPWVPVDLVIVGDDWWLERREYDGEEWWVYSTPPIRPPNRRVCPESLRHAWASEGLARCIERQEAEH